MSAIPLADGCSSSNQVTARHAAATPTAPRGPQRAEAPGRLPHHGQKGTTPAPQGRCDRSPLHGQDRPRADRDRDRPACSARPAVPDAIAEQLTSRAASSPHGCPDRAPRLRTRERPAPAPPARPPSRSPGSPAQPSAHPPSPAARPRHITGAGRPCVRECTPDSAAHVKPEPAAGAARPWLSVESRRCVPTVLAAGRRPLTCIAAVTQVVPRWPHLWFPGVLHCAPLP
jgi:hypothetical protein